MRSALFSKLNLKHQREIAVLSAPPSFERELAKLKGVSIRRRVRRGEALEFVLVFATRRTEVDAFARLLAKAGPGDAIVWVAYPKGTSKRYTCDFNRDTGWRVLGGLGFEAVRQVAIDEDWSALRFRRAGFIKSLQRAPPRAMSAEGRKKVAQRAKVR
jgi:hypothetical protein